MATAMRKKSKRTSKKKAAAKTPNPAFAFLFAFMKRRPKAVYADAAAAAQAAGHKIFPIMWGRAQVLLGRATAKKKSTAKAPAAQKATSTGKRRVGRPRGSKNVVKSKGGFSIPVDDDAVHQMSELVEALNSGGKAMLRYDGKSWVLAVD